jgi:hypothetical protein
MVVPSGARGGCNATLRGELVQAQDLPQASGSTFLFFTLFETAPDNGTRTETAFQSFVFPNARTTLPIPFELSIDSPKDCPGELKLRVGSSDTDRPVFRFASWYPPLYGEKTVRLDKFESIAVRGPRF